MSDPEETIAELTRAYAITFGSPAGQIVLKDLEAFGHIGDPLVADGARDRSERRFFMNEGRREVLLRVMKFANFTLSDIYNMRKGALILRTNEGEDIQ